MLSRSIPFFVPPGSSLLRCRLRNRSCLHTSITRLADNGSHYDVLSLPQSATATDIKRRFYELSKTHHPDRNRDDPNASSRFVKISQAYHVLRNTQAREKYDRELQAQQGIRAGSGSGPYTSSAGGRPASGLSRRRSHFKGPPPSFFRNGGWSTFKGKTQSNSQRNTSGTSEGGFGVGGEATGQNNDVPHFNYGGKYEQHVEQQRRQREKFEAPRTGIDPGFIIPCLAVVTILILTVSTATKLGEADEKPSKRK